jgi:hypothetical protein
MNEQDLDRIIDCATTEMVGREPSRALRHKVMARVRETEAPAPRRLAWATALAVAVLCGAIAIALLNRTAARPVADRGVRPSVVAPADPPARVDPAAPANRQVAGAVESATPVARPAQRRLPRPTFVPNDLWSGIEPIAAEPLELSSIDLPPLENQPASVERLEIEELTIEPLTASND